MRNRNELLELIGKEISVTETGNMYAGQGSTMTSTIKDVEFFDFHGEKRCRLRFDSDSNNNGFCIITNFEVDDVLKRGRWSDKGTYTNWFYAIN